MSLRDNDACWNSYTHRSFTLLPCPKAWQWVRPMCLKEPTWLCRDLVCSALATWNNLPCIFVNYILAVLRFSTFIVPNIRWSTLHSEQLWLCFTSRRGNLLLPTLKRKQANRGASNSLYEQQNLTAKCHWQSRNLS